jgi:hypothetical protein
LMSPSVMALPDRNFKFLTEGSLGRTGNIDFAKKREEFEICPDVGRLAFHVLRKPLF